MTSAQVARILGTNRSTLHYWIKSGRIEPPLTDPSNGYYVWTRNDVEAAIRRKEEPRS